jgi:hypothetical protein
MSILDGMWFVYMRVWLATIDVGFDDIMDSEEDNDAFGRKLFTTHGTRALHSSCMISFWVMNDIIQFEF